MKHLSGVSLYSRLLAVHTNISLGFSAREKHSRIFQQDLNALFQDCEMSVLPLRHNLDN
jgi:hypothetical protein